MQASGGRGALVRWLLAYGTFSVPQAAGPIAFALLALPLTGRASSGAAIVLVITVAQVVGAVPVARMGRRALFSYGQITMRKVDGWQTIDQPLTTAAVPLDLVA